MREDFVPWLCKLQYQRSKQERYASGVYLTIIRNTRYLLHR